MKTRFIKQSWEGLDKESRDFLDDLYDIVTGTTEYGVTVDSFWEKWVYPYENVGNEYSIPWEVDTGTGEIRLGKYKLTLSKNDFLFDENDEDSEELNLETQDTIAEYDYDDDFIEEDDFLENWGVK